MNCTDIGTIQAFLDGELSFARSSELSEHIAACDNCAVMLADAETESALVFPVLERELDTLVPTQRLWNKINDSIELEKESQPWWTKVGAFVSVLFASPSMSVAAASLIVAFIGGAFWLNRGVDNGPVAAVKAPIRVSTTAKPTLPTSEPPDDPTRAITPVAKPEYSIQTASYRPERSPRRRSEDTVSNAIVRTAAIVDNSGEENYINTIATLNKSVKDQKDEAMRPSERVAYERDMALVNDTIAKMRKEVEKNPKNNGARQVLYNSYQNKIDLLTSVAQKEELTASIR